jgi:MYXO-CTERM domain-containing protein
MKTRAAFAVAVLGAAASALAQDTQGSSVTWSLQAFRATPTTPGNFASGVTVSDTALTAADTLNLNEAVLLRISFTLSGTPGGVDENFNPTGSPLTWNPLAGNPPLGGSGAGGLGGLWSGDLNVSVSEATGTWSNNTASFQSTVRRALLSPYGASGDHGYIGGSNIAANINATGPAGLVTDIQPIQFGADAVALSHGNGAVVWRGLWIPANYSARTVNFNVALGWDGFLSDVYAIDATYGAGGRTLPVPLSVATNFGAGPSVHIVPGPSSLALLGLGALAAGRRRR